MTAGQAPPDDDDGYWGWFTAPVPDQVVISERAVTGAMITSAALAAAAVLVLAPRRVPGGPVPQYFAHNSHQAVYETVVAMLDRGVPVEPATVMAELARAGLLHRIGDSDGGGTGGAYLHSLMTWAGSAEYHAGEVLAAWQQRNVASELRSCSQIAAAPGWDPDVHLDVIRSRVDAATAFAGAQALRPPWRAVLDTLDAQEAGTADPGLTTGFPDIDGVLGGLRNGEVTVLAAPPGAGKTTLALNIADHVAIRLGLPVFMASLEMREQQLTAKRIAAAAAVPLWRLVRNDLGDADWARIARVHSDLAAARLYVDDTPGVPLSQIRGRLAELARAGNRARLAVIDHLGLLAMPKAESRQQAVAQQARDIKTFARQEDIPVLLVCPVSRAGEHRGDRVPRLSDLRDSGEVEGNADNVLLLYREPNESPRSGEVDVIFGKNRMGPPATVTLAWQGHFSRMVSMSPADGWSPSAGAGAAASPVVESEGAAQERRDELAERRRQAEQGGQP